MQKVLAAILEKEGRFLIARRREGDRFAGLWEFPGGKLEPGETEEICLRRELHEEFGVEAEVGRFLAAVSFVSKGLSIELLAYEAFHIAGEFKLRDHDEIRWVSSDELNCYPLSLPDLKILPQIRKLVGRRKP